MKFSKNPLGSFKELPSGYFGGYFERYPLLTCWVKVGQIVSEPSMYLAWTHWVIDPLPPVSTEGSLLEAETSDASGDDSGIQGSGEDNMDVGVSTEGSMGVRSPFPREVGLIEQMEREATEAGLGGWFNRNPEGILESWSGSNSGALASQDQVGTTLLITIGS